MKERLAEAQQKKEPQKATPEKTDEVYTPKDGDVQLTEPEAPPAPVTHEGPVRQGLKGKLWYKAIREGQARIDDALPYWEAVIEDSHQHLAFKGALNDLLTEHPGLAYFYRSIMTDAQQVRRYLEMKAEQAEQAKYKWLMTTEDAKKEYGALKTTEAAKFAKADEEVLNLQDQVRVMANIEHQLDNVALGFQDRGIMLSHIRAVREAGHEEVFIDSRLETDTR